MGHKYKINNDLFKQVTPYVAYLMGLIWSDGYMNNRGIRITSKDIDFLESIPSFFDMTAPVYRRKGINVGDLVFNSKHFQKDLLSFGFHNKKSIFGKPIIDDSIFSHFSRGLIDGDGCIIAILNEIQSYSTFILKH